MSIICALASLCLIGVFAAHAVGDINHHERPESMLLAIGIVLLLSLIHISEPTRH